MVCLPRKSYQTQRCVTQIRELHSKWNYANYYHLTIKVQIKYSLR